MLDGHSKNRIARFVDQSEPNPEEIARECEQIQSSWDHERAQARRIDEAERKFHAHLRFIQFLTETTRS